MMKDKTTIIVIVVCMLALIGWQQLVNLLYPPKPKPVTTPELVVTNNVVAATTNAAAMERTEPPPSIKPPAVATTEASAAETPRPPERLIVVENEFLRATLTSWGGGIRSVELFNFKSNGSGNVVLNATNQPPALAIRDDHARAYDVEQLSDSKVRFRSRTVTGSAITKTLELVGDYLFHGMVEVSSPTSETLPLLVGTATPVNAKEPPDLLGVGWLVGHDYEGLNTKQLGKRIAKKGDTESVNARWVAVHNQFFTLLLNPETNTTALGFSVADIVPPPNANPKTPPQGAMAWVNLQPAQTNATGNAYGFTYYAGPKQYNRLVALGDDEDEVMQFGFWGLISVALLRSMNFFYGLIPNYGVAIILITFIIKIIFWPIQSKSMKSMRQMQKFQPLMQKLREKYKDDAARMNQEMMKLYKEHKINPFAGCLPMLVQIPVFFAFYTMLRSAIELRGASFLWMHDLSQPDTIAHIAGFPINPLPLVMGVSMIAQMKLTPSGGDPKQQQMMMFMPLIFLFICYNMSSGLVLYWTVQQFLSIAHQWWALRYHAEPAAASPATPAPRAPTRTK